MDSHGHLLVNKDFNLTNLYRAHQVTIFEK